MSTRITPWLNPLMDSTAFPGGGTSISGGLRGKDASSSLYPDGLAPGQMQVCKHIYTHSVRRGSLLTQWQRCFHCPTIVPLKMTNVHGVGGSRTSFRQIMRIYFTEQCEKLSYIGHIQCFQSVTIRTLNDQQSKFSFVPAGVKKRKGIFLYSFFLTQGAVIDFYLRMATVRASEELAHGQITSGRSPRA